MSQKNQINLKRANIAMRKIIRADIIATAGTTSAAAAAAATATTAVGAGSKRKRTKPLDFVAQQAHFGAQLQILLLQIDDPNRELFFFAATHVSRPLGTLVVFAPLLPVIWIFVLHRHRASLLEWQRSSATTTAACVVMAVAAERDETVAISGHRRGHGRRRRRWRRAN
jgi:hypothetical protein